MDERPGGKGEIIMAVSEELLKILACPKCKGVVEMNEERKIILCRSCRLAYPVRDDIPIMLIDEAAPWESEES